MDPRSSAPAVLGTEWIEIPRRTTRVRGILRARFESSPAPSDRILDWLIDGVPLRDLLPDPDLPENRMRYVPVLDAAAVGEEFAIGALRTLIDRDGTFLDPRFRFWDGRTALLYCSQCFGLDCGAVTADIRYRDGIVEWREVAWQNADLGRPGQLQDPFTIRFDKAQYEALLLDLIRRWSAPI